MPIERIELENFQSHKNTSLELSPGMNVIWGDTDHGKSSIIRGIKWVVLNRPTGDDYRRHETKKTEVTLETDNFIVQRRRTNSKNEYEIDEEVLETVGVDVPEEISSALKLSEANIQSQHEVYFLIDKSPGQRAKILNEVAGLQIMDEVLKKTNSEIRSVNTDIRSTNKLITESQSTQLELEWVTKADKFLSRLEQYEQQIKDLETHFEKVSFIIYQIKELEAVKSEFLSDKALSEINGLIKMRDDIEELEFKYNHISNLVESAKILKKRKELFSDIDISELEKLQDNIDFLEKKRKRVQDVIDEIKFKKEQHHQLFCLVGETEEKIEKELKRLGECPTCGAKI